MRSAMIIGAGPAGSTAAIVLARRGWDVTIVEQHRFTRDKVCGECISALGIDVLRRRGISLPDAVKLRRTTLAAMNGREVTIDLPREMWALSRKRLDAVMLDRARDAGAKVLQPARREDSGRGTGASPVHSKAWARRPCHVRDLMTNRLQSFVADAVLIADGKSRAHTKD